MLKVILIFAGLILLVLMFYEIADILEAQDREIRRLFELTDLQGDAIARLREELGKEEK